MTRPAIGTIIRRNSTGASYRVTAHADSDRSANKFEARNLYGGNAETFWYHPDDWSAVFPRA